MHVRLSGLKYTFLLVILQLLTSFVASHFINRIFVDDTMNTLVWAFVASILKPILYTALETMLNQASTDEACIIATNISKDMLNALNMASNEVSVEIPSSAIITAVTDAFYAYYNTTHQIIRMFPELVDFIVVVYVATDKSWMMTQIFLFGSTIIFLIQQTIDKKMEKISKEMVQQTHLTRLKISRSWTNLFTWLQMPYYEKPEVPNIEDGIKIWRHKDKETKLSHLITDILQGFFSLTCLLFVTNKTIMIWLILNHHRLWKGVILLRRLSEIVMHNQAKMTTHLDNFHKSMVSSKKNYPLSNETGVIRITDISVTQPNCDKTVILETPLCFEPDDRIVLEGPKGSGKTFLISILTRLIDVITNMTIMTIITPLGIKIEPSNLRIFKVFQTISSLFTENHKKTISHTLEELFPDCQIEDLFHFLRMFDLEGIVPKCNFPLTVPLGKNETSLSPGTVRTIVLAHLIWKLQKLLESGKIIQMVVLDEIDTAIDFGTVLKFYTECIDPLLQKYNLPCIIVSHSKEFRDLVKVTAGRKYKMITTIKEGNVITYR